MDCSPSLWQQEAHFGFPLLPPALLTLALVSAVLALKRWYVFLWLSGFAAYMALVGAILYSVHLASLLPPERSPFGFNPGPEESFTFAIGFYFLGLGVLLIFGGALVDGILDQRRPTLPVLPARRFEWRDSEPTWVNRIAMHGPIGEG
jgi:hypothetical protein